MNSIIITGCDRGYFSSAQELIRSLRRDANLAGQKIGFLDFGLEEHQRRWVSEQGVEIKPGRWDFDFPSRAEFEAMRPWFAASLCRPLLRDYFPGHEVYLWLDADTWVQQSEAVEQLLAAAAWGGMAIVPAIDRCYQNDLGCTARWQAELDFAVRCLGSEIGQRLRAAPGVNPGVIAIRADAPQWGVWSNYLQTGLNRLDPRDAMSHLVMQVALSATTYLHQLPSHHFPSTYNWLAPLAPPAWDIDSQAFVEPARPHRPIGIMHLGAALRTSPIAISVLVRGDLFAQVTGPLTLASQESLAAAQPQLRLAAADHVAAAARVLPEMDYVSPGLKRVEPDRFFANLTSVDKRVCNWGYFRREIPHRYLVDRRSPETGFLNRDEAHILYNMALQFRGRRALEIGCWMGWSACHLALAGVMLDVVDPLLADPSIRGSVEGSLQAASVLDSVNLLSGTSPATVHRLATEHRRKWSLFFIDGDHEGDAPRQDAIECERHAEADSAMIFHDLASPDVAAGLRYLHERGWLTRVYHTMQIMGVAWRGAVEPVNHVPDPRWQWTMPAHLRDFPT